MLAKILWIAGGVALGLVIKGYMDARANPTATAAGPAPAGGGTVQ